MNYKLGTSYLHEVYHEEEEVRAHDINVRIKTQLRIKIYGSDNPSVFPLFTYIQTKDAEKEISLSLYTASLQHVRQLSA